MKSGFQKWIILLLIAAAAAACMSCAQRGLRGHQQERFRAEQPQTASLTPDMLLLDLYLTEDQAAKIAVLRDGFLKELRPLQAKMKIERQRHKEFVASQTMANSGAESEHSMNLESLQGLVQAKRELYLQSVMQLLNPEQKALLKSAIRPSRSTSNRWDGPNMDGDGRGPGPDGGDGMGGQGQGGMGGRGRPGW